MNVNKIRNILFFPRKKCSHFIKCIKRTYKILFVNNSGNNNFLHMMKTCNSYNLSKKKIVLFNIDENNLNIRKRINKVVTKFNILSNIYGYIICFVLISCVRLSQQNVTIISIHVNKKKRCFKTNYYFSSRH
ncbi:hypothetical protein PFFCH_01727 [Plasmodium falciparum FCH/4]|uniref:Uncharacterized protein n=1 Tax=Plasmodium falciparum FCH/4 TaxID=1036724 RepID=A0A024VQX2_PLAFA|nr:hypothetical protein PFFCH_01727 [Plasmodium falciparum FCH/4]